MYTITELPVEIKYYTNIIPSLVREPLPIVYTNG